jgi:hypothetical protein
MKIIINHSKIKRRAQLSNLASVGGLVLLLAGVVVPLFRPAWASFSYILTLAGMGVAMVGIYFANRWVRRPRPEESLPQALKSFDDSYRLYLYPSLPCDHILLSPTGLVPLEVVNLSGQYSYRQGQWKESMRLGRALRYIVEERVSNPVEATKQVEEELKELVAKEFGSETRIPIKAVYVFTHPATVLDVKEASVPVCKVDKLKKYATINAPRLDKALYEKLASFLEEKTVS